MRLVLDTNVAVSAVLGSSAPTRLIELAAEGAFDLFTSAALLAELAEVLDREHWASPDIPDTFDKWDDDIGGEVGPVLRPKRLIHAIRGANFFAVAL